MPSSPPAMESAVLSTVKDREVCTDPAVMSTKWAGLVGRMALAMNKSHKTLPDRDHQTLYEILKSFRNIDHIDRSIQKRLEIDYALKVVLGISDNDLLRRLDYRFPDAFRNDAQIIYNELSERLRVVDKATASAAPPPNQSQRAVSSDTASTRAQRPLQVFDDPRISQMMRNVGYTNGAYHILNMSLKRDADVIGNNGILLGQWWPLRICALRDGAHGHLQAGIAGGVTSGCFSIVLGKEYEDFDKDEGNLIHYSSSGARESRNPDQPNINAGTLALRQSCSQRRLVRVIRAAGGNRQYAPSVGCRYDGLYQIMGEREAINSVGGKYVRFELRRAPGQAPIPLDRPSAHEKGLYDFFKSSM